MTMVDVTIDAIAAGGDGIGRADGMVIFVPRTAPGDVVRVQINARKSFARGVLEEVLTPSPTRIDPICYHYRVDRCGACQLQHVSYDAQIEAKRGIIRDAVTRIGKRPIELPEVEASDKQWEYRRKLTLAMRRTHGEWRIGLHPFGDPVSVFQISDCPITDPRVMTVWRQVMEARQHFPPADELRASVRLLDDGGAASIVMEGAHTWPNRLAFFEAVPGAVALWWRPVHRARMLVAERGGGRPSGTASFEQINFGVGRALHSYVLDRVRLHRPAFVIDAYAGSGATAVPIANDGVRVLAIESDRNAVAQCEALLPAGSRAVAALVEDVMADALPADVVLINPPRTGIHEGVASALETVVQTPRAIIYVSCDPATLARDLARMPRYRIESIRGFDMFPQTSHVETVCELVPVAA
jgi:23S rRNA (uracil1939-C5)-methyltransferase